MKCVKIENDVVVNSALFDVCGDGWVESDASIGWIYLNGEFSAPIKSIPVGFAEDTTQSKMRSELDWCDLILKYIASGDTSRSGVLTTVDIYAYAIKCRNHVISTDGVLSIVGDIPVRP